jgi:hypothetical protein
MVMRPVSIRSYAQRVFLRAGNLSPTPLIRWRVYGDPYVIKK